MPSAELILGECLEITEESTRPDVKTFHDPGMYDESLGICRGLSKSELNKEVLLFYC